MGERKLSKISDGKDGGALSSAFNRRSFVKTATLGSATAAALAAASGLGMPTSALASTKNSNTSSTGPTLVDAGAGMHTGIGTVQMLASATVSSKLSTCQVAQMGMDFSEIPDLGPLLEQFMGGVVGSGFSGPFAMCMYTLDVTSWKVDRSAGTLTGMGTLRSITKIGGLSVEDVTSPYLVVAKDGSRTGGPDTFFLNFTTPFWTAPTNPLATASQFHKGWSQFGGNFIVGEVSVPAK